MRTTQVLLQKRKPDEAFLQNTLFSPVKYQKTTVDAANQFKTIITELLEPYSNIDLKKTTPNSFSYRILAGDILVTIADTHYYFHTEDTTRTANEKAALVLITQTLYEKSLVIRKEKYTTDMLETLQNDYNNTLEGNNAPDKMQKRIAHYKKNRIQQTHLKYFKTTLNKYMQQLKENFPNDYLTLLDNVVSSLKLNVLKIPVPESRYLTVK
jgi:hypothetical protein